MAVSLTPEQKEKIASALRDRRAEQPCVRCGNTEFSLPDGLSTVSLSDGKSITLGGPGIPVALLICSRCGAIYFHAVGVLGLFPEFGISVPEPVKA